jgi:hypothetical protein
LAVIFDKAGGISALRCFRHNEMVGRRITAATGAVNRARVNLDLVFPVGKETRCVFP